MTHPIPYVDLAKQYAEERDDLLPIIDKALSTGQWILGDDVQAFEVEAAAFCDVPFVVAVNSGTDALILALRALGIGAGDEVITTPNSYIASASAIIHAGATPVFCDVLPDQNIDPEHIEKHITPRTKAIMPIHLTGRMARMDAIMAIAQKHTLKVIEDCAQAIGSRYQNRMAGSWCDAGCFSTHPLKNLNAMGDGGFITVKDSAMAELLKRLRMNGHKDRNTCLEWGIVSRLDTMQAAILRYRLKKLPAIIEKRRAHAALYTKLFEGSAVFIPPANNAEFNTYHTFVVQLDQRDAAQTHLQKLGIGTSIHYPVPIHLQPAAHAMKHKAGDFPLCEAQAARILSLPIHQYVTEAEIERVATTLKDFLLKS